MRRLLAGAAVLVLGTAAVSAGGTPPRLAFDRSVPVITSPLGSSARPLGEPRVLVTSTGRILVSAQFQQWDCGSKRPSTSVQTCVWGSDDGRAFRILGGIDQQGDDVDFAETSGGALLMSAMANPKVGGLSTGTGMLGSVVLRSGDRGRTWSQHDNVNLQVANDRPFLATTPHAAVLSYLGIPGSIEVVRSTDEGRSWSLPTVVVPTPPPGVVYENDVPAWDPRHKQLLVPFAWSSQPTCAAFTGTAGCIDRIDMASSSDEGVTWTREPVVTLSGLGMTTIASLAVDAAGRRTLAFTAARGFSAGTAIADRDVHVYLTSSPGPGAPWSAPRRVDPTGGSAMMPMLAAGRAGQISVAYYASRYGDAGAVVRPWGLVVSDSRDGGRTWTTATVTPRAYVGTARDHQTAIWDLFGIARDRHGRLVVVWTDDGGRPGGPTTVRLARQVRP